MPAPNKIEKYKLGSRVERMQADGLTTTQIAEKLTSEFETNGIRDSISQSSVSRYLKDIEDYRKTEAEALAARAENVIRQHLDKTAESDLQVLEDIKQFFLNIVNDQLSGHEFNIKTRMEAAKNATKTIETKLRLLNDPDNSEEPGPGEEESSVSPGSELYGLFEELDELANTGAKDGFEEGSEK